MFYPYFWILSTIVQVVFVVHVIMRRNDYFWIFIILFFPVVGCAVYALVIWIPEARHSRTARGTSKAVLSIFDPRRELRRRLGNLDMSDSVENRILLAKELANHGMIEDALGLYERSLKGVYEDDAQLLLGYASALFEAKRLQEARSVLDKLRPMNLSLKTQEAQLLHARVLEQLGETQHAEKQYAAVVQAFGGIEAKCRYGLFLKQLGKGDAARPLFQDILLGAKHAGSHSRRLNREWISIAKRELAA